MTKSSIIGWDIGGAHVKAALFNSEGRLLNLALFACPLWKGLSYLQDAIQQTLEQFSVSSSRHVLTMTGELVDLFQSREQGVEMIIQQMLGFVSPQDLVVYAAHQGFLSPQQVDHDQCIHIASANWLASASLVANNICNGLFVDMGSTTTDILLIEDYRVKARGLSDYQRLLAEELVYTGMVRTPVIAVAQRAVFRQQEMSLMAEFFASMADVYRLTGDLNEAHDLSETADGGAKTVPGSALRLSRMTGYDFNEQDIAMWQALALEIKKQQKKLIEQAMKLQLQRTDKLVTTIVGAGIGRSVIKEIADDNRYSFIDFDQLVDINDSVTLLAPSDCAPAVAVARLALEAGLV
jgi:probable H4MPT-linked C1 transfer pathway protein